MNGNGVSFLVESFERLSNQTFTDFEVVVSDHSINNSIKAVCEHYQGKLTIHYHNYPLHRGNSSANINNAMRYATGSFIKILFQDDFLFDDRALEQTAQALTDDTCWLASACIHTRDGVRFFRPFSPHYNNGIHLGKNTIGSPSVLTIKNDGHLLFDEQLVWLMDVDYYKRLFDGCGAPRLLPQITVVNRIGKHQVTRTLATFGRRRKEFLVALNTYEHGARKWYYWCTYTVRHIIRAMFPL